MSTPCLICDRIREIREGRNALFVKELSTGFIVLGDFQFWRGYTLFLCKEHVTELHDLPRDLRLRYLDEMATVAQAVHRTFSPRKMNYELLGNSEPHLHWHLFPRYLDELLPKQPVWLVDKSIRYAESARPNTDEIAQMKAALLRHLDDKA